MFHYIHSFHYTICMLIHTINYREANSYTNKISYVRYREVCYLAGWLLCVQIYITPCKHSIVPLAIQAQFDQYIHIPAGDDHWPSLTVSARQGKRQALCP